MEFRHASGVKPSTNSTSGDNPGRFDTDNPYVANMLLRIGYARSATHSISSNFSLVKYVPVSISKDGGT